MANLHGSRSGAERRNAEYSTVASAETATEKATEHAAREQAALLIEADNLPGARALLDPFATSGRHVGTLTTLARVCTDQGDFEAALAALERAEVLDPSDRKTWRLKAKLLAALRRHREALVYLRRLALLDSDAPASAHVDLLRGLLRTFDKSSSGTPAVKASNTELERTFARFLKSPGRTSQLDQQCAGLYYLLSNGSPQAIRIYAEADPCPPTHRDVTARLIKLEKLGPIRRPMPDPDSVARKGWALCELADVQIHSALGWLPVLATGEAMASGYVLHSKRFRGVNPASPLMLFRGSHAELRLPKDVPVVHEAAFLLGGSSSYYETLIHHFSGLAKAECCGLPPDAVLVVGADMPGFQLELLSLLGYADRRRVEVAADCSMGFHRLFVPSLVEQDADSEALARWFRSRLTNEACVAHRKLYVQPGHDVEISNADAVNGLFESHGYERVDVSSMSVAEQASLFAEALAVAGVSSEGMTNLTFCIPGAKVLELRPVHWKASGGQMDFERLARAFGHSYAVEECARVRASTDLITISVDLDSASRWLEALS